MIYGDGFLSPLLCFVPPCPTSIGETPTLTLPEHGQPIKMLPCTTCDLDEHILTLQGSRHVPVEAEQSSILQRFTGFFSELLASGSEAVKNAIPPLRLGELNEELDRTFGKVGTITGGAADATKSAAASAAGFNFGGVIAAALIGALVLAVVKVRG